MNKNIKRMVAASTAAASIMGCAMPLSSFADEKKAEMIGDCEYDKLIEMRDKTILVKNGEGKRYTVIDKDGKVNTFTNESGIKDICTYGSTGDGLIKYAKYLYSSFAFDFDDKAHKISTESGCMIVKTGYKTALADKNGKIISDEYENIYRINDNYFIIDESDSQTDSEFDRYHYYYKFASNKCGLMAADGTVIVPPTPEVCGFFAFGENFIKWETDGFSVIDKTGKTISEKYKQAYIGLESRGYFSHLLETAYGGKGEVYRSNYDFSIINDEDIIFENDVESGSKLKNNLCIYSQKTGKVSEPFEETYYVNSEKYGRMNICYGDGKMFIVDRELNERLVVEKGYIYNSHYKDTETIEVEHYGIIDIYDTDLQLIESRDILDDTEWVKNGTLSFDDDSIFVTANVPGAEKKDITDYIVPYDEELLGFKWLRPYDVVENYPYMYSETDNEALVIAELGYDRGIGMIMDKSIVKFVLDSNQVPHIVNDCIHAAQVGPDTFLFVTKDGSLRAYDYKTDKEVGVDVLKGLTDYNRFTDASGKVNTFLVYNNEKGYIINSDFEKVSDDLYRPMGYSDLQGNYYAISHMGENQVYKYALYSVNDGIILDGENTNFHHGNTMITEKDGDTIIIDLERSPENMIVERFSGSYDLVDVYADMNDPVITLTKYVRPELDPFYAESTIAYDLSKQKIVFEQNGKYTNMTRFTNGFADAVKSEKEFCIIDLEGSVVASFNYRDADDIYSIGIDKNGIGYSTYANGKNTTHFVKFSDINNEFCNEYGYDLARKEGSYYYVENAGRCGIVTADNDVVVPVEYKNIFSFNESEYDMYYFLNEEVRETLSAEFTSKLNRCSNGDTYVYVQDSNNKIGIYKLAGKSYTLGDVDGSGGVDSNDASAVLREYALVSTGEKGTFTAEQKAAADVNGDGAINSSDASMILQYYSYISTGGNVKFMADWLKNQEK